MQNFTTRIAETNRSETNAVGAGPAAELAMETNQSQPYKHPECCVFLSIFIEVLSSTVDTVFKPRAPVLYQTETVQTW
ncbi:hypothetical protein RRG08_029362 [Elysia crispata]|uniref:Uncharacterized protein n=1 Tax=Elysia crispata TaxID=231223 RepID=A0AAE1B9I3_9GAST|nr:hypothetical protein RRG08_029362 [Elysia crispata]